MSSQYRPFRRRQRIVVPPSTLLTTFTAAAVVGMLIIDTPAVGPVGLVASYVALCYTAGRLPTSSTYMNVACMFAACAANYGVRGRSFETLAFFMLTISAFLIAGVVESRRRRGR